ncbi:isoprenylcysteine carboxylmethyltransferase family protein [Candidatus Thorarchaeota archaeon]|nr:MAG: isoprenylcysteine carboxylmethyltransferase family protein [Candidatus Thorarchaeota archaeon]
MVSSLFFRISFLMLWATFGVVRGYYARKTKTHESLSGVTEKLKAAERDMSTAFKILTGVITVVGGVGLILYLLAPPWWTWTYLPLGEWFQWLGIFVAIPPIFYLIWVHRHLDTQWSIALELQEDHKLIKTGPYKKVRHPMYLGIFIYTIGLIFISADILVFLFFGFSIWVNYRRIPDEEQMMIDEFGDEYREYMEHSGKLLPPVRRKHK